MSYFGTVSPFSLHSCWLVPLLKSWRHYYIYANLKNNLKRYHLQSTDDGDAPSFMSYRYLYIIYFLLWRVINFKDGKAIDLLFNIVGLNVV